MLIRSISNACRQGGFITITQESWQRQLCHQFLLRHNGLLPFCSHHVLCMSQTMQMPRSETFWKGKLNRSLTLTVCPQLRVEESKFGQIGTHISIALNHSLLSLFSHHLACKFLCCRIQSHSTLFRINRLEGKIGRLSHSRRFHHVEDSFLQPVCSHTTQTHSLAATTHDTTAKQLLVPPCKVITFG